MIVPFEKSPPQGLKSARNYSNKNILNHTVNDIQQSKPLFSQRGKPPIVRHMPSNPLAHDKELARIAHRMATKPKKTIVRDNSASLFTGDIEGSKPKSYRQIRKSYSSLCNDDIVGSKPNYAKKFEKKV